MDKKKKKKSTVTRRRKIRSFFKFLKIVFIIIIAIFFAGYVAVKLYLNDLDPIPQLKTYNRNIVTQVYSSDGHVIKNFQTFHYEQATIDEIPKEVKDAIIATEDKNFYSHDGYDVFGIARSLIVNIMNRKTTQGASTITQQLARILFLSNEKTMIRKIKEIQIAARIEKTISKDKILEMYLNNVYLGSGAYGVGAAATTYFNKELSQLTLAESALIAGLPQAPSIYSPYKNMDLAEKRRNKVLKRMYITKKINKKQYEEAIKEKIVLNKKPSTNRTNIAPYFIDYVLRELEQLGFDETEIVQGGYKITTTLDYQAQDTANKAIDKIMEEWKLTKPKNQAGLFSFSPMTGEIIAYCGGKDYAESQYDRVTQAIRPPGSSFKPFVYAAAVLEGYMPNDIISDSPITIGDWTPRNYGDKYKGKMPLYKALAISSNVIAVKLIKDIGIDAVIDMAKTLGITTPLTHDYTIALGSNGVKLYDMVVAYGTFANGGYRVQPYAIQKIETQRGKTIYEAGRTRIVKVLDKDTAGVMTGMLRTVITSGTGRAANINKPMAGKTGTTNENRDAWFIGYTPDIVTGVFIGNDDNTSTGLTGGTAPARIWKEMMTVVTQKYGATEFDYKPIEKGDWVDNKKPAVVIKTEDAKAGNWAFDDDDNDVKEVIKRPEKKENEAENGIKNKKKNINEIDYKLPPIQPVTITPTEVEIDNFRSIPVQLNDNLIKKE